MCCCLMTTTFGTDQTYLVVGTGFIVEGEDSCKHGRILIFAIQNDTDDAKLVLVGSNDVNGCVYVMKEFRNKILAGVNNIVYTFLSILYIFLFLLLLLL